MPAAIAAPTPVSSLVHSSTLVTAGVYILIRFYYILMNLFFIKFFTFISILTSLIAGIIACVEPDLKKVVAMSTLSQLGLIIFIISLGEIMFCYFHIVCHALFKALLFLSCGIIIFMRMGNQDIRIIGSFSIINPILVIMFLLRRMSLFGTPFLAGFYSKDSILEVFLVSEDSIFLFILLFVCCILTIVYRFRLFFYGVRSSRVGEIIFKFNSYFSFYIPILILLYWTVYLGKMYSLIIFNSFLNIIFFTDKLVGIFVLLVGFLGTLVRI